MYMYVYMYMYMYVKVYNEVSKKGAQRYEEIWDDF